MIDKRIENKLETIERHNQMACKVFQCKFSNLSKEQEFYLNRLFKEAKYFYNDLILSDDIFKYDYKNNLCIIKNALKATGMGRVCELDSRSLSLQA